jgi:hypothetical protein
MLTKIKFALIAALALSMASAAVARPMLHGDVTGNTAYMAPGP